MRGFFKVYENRIFFLLSLLLFFGFSYFLIYHLGNYPYIDWDESIYAQVAKESLLNKNFFDLTYFGQPWYEKPPLLFWLLSASYTIGGVNEWAGRFPTVLSALGIVIISLRWIYEIYKSYIIVFIAMFSFYIASQFLGSAAVISIDMIVALLAFLSIYAWWKSQNDDRWFLVWGISIGLGIMTKSVVGLFPLIPIAIYSIINLDLSFFKKGYFWKGICALLLVVSPWHIYQSLKVGEPFWNNYFLHHVLQRFSTNLENNGAPFLYYINNLFFTDPFKSVVYFGSIILALYLSFKDKSIRFIFLSFLCLLLFFSISTTKGPLYITMIMPFLVMLVATAIYKLTEYIPNRFGKLFVIFILALTFIYNGYEFNQYKLAKKESLDSFHDSKDIGLFLRDYQLDLPIYIDSVNHKNLGVGYYSNREVIPTTDTNLLQAENVKVFHRHTQEVFLGDKYILIKRY